MIPTRSTFPTRWSASSEEAGIQFVFGCPWRHRPHLRRAARLARDPDDPGPPRAGGSIKAEMYGRLIGQPGVVMGQGIFLACNALFGSLEAVKGRRRCCSGDFTDHGALHAPRPVPGGHRRARQPRTSESARGARPSTRGVTEPSKRCRRSSSRSSTRRPALPTRRDHLREPIIRGTGETRRPPRLHATAATWPTGSFDPRLPTSRGVATRCSRASSR